MQCLISTARYYVMSVVIANIMPCYVMSVVIVSIMRCYVMSVYGASKKGTHKKLIGRRKIYIHRTC